MLIAMSALSLKTARREILPHARKRVGRSHHVNPDRSRAKRTAPRNFASGHLVYIMNNPLSGRDPSGYAAETHTAGSTCGALGGQADGCDAVTSISYEALGSATKGVAQKDSGSQKQSTTVTSSNAADATAPTQQKAVNNPQVPMGPSIGQDDQGHQPIDISSYLGGRKDGTKVENFFGEPFVTVGRDFASLAVYLEGLATGNERMMETALDIMSENESANKQMAITLLVSTRGGPRGGAANGFRSVDELSQAAAAADRGGLSAAGRALQKHGGREGSAFPPVSGNPASINRQGQSVVDDILTSPGSMTVTRNHARYGEVMEVRAPDGRGVRYDANGKFMGFLEPKP